MGAVYESWVERRIREAQERGAFDDLPGAGRPLDLGDPQDEDWWVRRLIERERLDMTAVLPPQLVLRREAQTLPRRVMAERSERAVRELLEDFNARVRECWRRPVEGPMVVVRTVDVERLLDRWRAQQPPRRPATGHRAVRRDTGAGTVRRCLRRLLGTRSRA